MATILTGVALTIGSTSLSSYLTKVELTCDSDEVDATTFTSGGSKAQIQGLKNAQLKMTFDNSYVDNELDEIMWTLYAAGANTTFKLAATTAATSSSNPVFTGSLTPKSWNPIGGSPGAKAESDVTWPVSGAVTRNTT